MRSKEQLENKINQQAHELRISLGIQKLLYEKLKSSTETLEEVVKLIEANIRYSKDYVYKLEQENKNLKASCDAWMKRAINLEFEVLSARADTGK